MLSSGQFVVADIQAYQRPDGEKYIRGGTGDIIAYSQALGEEGSYNLNSTRRSKVLAAKVC